MSEEKSKENTAIEQLSLIPNKKSQKEMLGEDQMVNGLLQLPPYLFYGIKDRIDTLPYPVLEGLAIRRPLSRKAMIDFKIPFNRHQMRELAIEAIYQHLLLDKNMKKVLSDMFRGSREIDGYLYGLTCGMSEHEEDYRDMISKRLRSDWSLERISLLEQAILLMSLQEMLEMQTPKAIVIDEAVNLAKQYCDDSAPKLINGVLDSVSVS